MATELMHLADYDRTIARRVKLLAKEADPKGLAAELGRRIGGLRRSSRFVHYRESFALALELAELVEAIANKVVPVDPERGFDLADAFLSTDDKTYGRVDDSSGSVADVYRAACDTWLRAAAGSNREQDWVARLYETATQNNYGVREPLLSHADLLLSEHELRRLAKRFEREAIAAAACPDDSGWVALSSFVSLGLVAEALRDPTLYERSLTLHSQPTRCLWRLFQMSPNATTYAQLVELLPPSDRAGAQERAIELALADSDISGAACFLLQVGAAAQAESLLMERFEQLEGTYYAHLIPLAKLAGECDSPRIEMLCYRQLLNDILTQARSKAYGHAARYYKRLAALDGLIDDYGRATDHQTFVEAVRDRHGRKYSFWRRVEG